MLFAGVLLYVFVCDTEIIVFIGGNTRDTAFLAYFDSFLIFALIAYALIVEILYWVHKSSYCKQ